MSTESTSAAPPEGVQTTTVHHSRSYNSPTSSRLPIKPVAPTHHAPAADPELFIGHQWVCDHRVSATATTRHTFIAPATADAHTAHTATASTAATAVAAAGHGEPTGQAEERAVGGEAVQADRGRVLPALAVRQEQDAQEEFPPEVEAVRAGAGHTHSLVPPQKGCGHDVEEMMNF